MVRRLEDLDFADDLAPLSHQIRNIAKINSKITTMLKGRTRKEWPIAIG